jgi:hypothetical protein
MAAAIGRLPFPAWKPIIAAVGRMTIALLFVAGMVAPLVLGAAPAAAQASTVSFSTAEAAPADAVAYAVASTDDRSDQSRLAKELLDRAGLGEAIDKAIASGLQDESGQKLPLDAFLGGEVAVVVTQTALTTLAEESMGTSDLEGMFAAMGEATPEAGAAAPTAQGFAIILDARAPDTAWAAIRESAKQRGQEETYQGTTILYEPPATANDEGSAAAKVGDLILLATTPADLYPVIDTADGDTPNITTLPQFSTARDALPTEFLTFSFVNSLSNFNVDLGPLAPAAGELLSDSYSASTIAADEPGFRMESVALPGEGAAPTPGAPNYESQLVNQAPDNSLIFMSAPNLGETGFLDSIGAVMLGMAFGMSGESMMEPSTPEAGGTPEEVIAKQYEDAAALLGVNLQTDLFQQFVGEYGGWLAADMDSQEVSGLFASHVADPDTVSNALMQLSYIIQGATGTESPLTTREVGGGQVYVIDLGDEAGSKLEFGVVGDQLVVGKSDAVDRLAGNSGESLATNTQFQAVMDTLPAEGNGTFYLDLSQAIPLMQAASAESEDFGLGSSTNIVDANAACGNYATQEEAQAAYDAADPDTFDLDQDFDGQVCEDYFAPSSNEGASSSDEVEQALANADYSAIKAFALVAHDDNGLRRTSSILYIAK